MTWHVHTTEVVVDDVAIIDWQILDESLLDTWHHFVANGLVPRGPGMGCHVAPIIVYGCLFKIYGVHWGSNPRPPHSQSLCKVHPANAPHSVPCYIYVFLYI
jgi:hypothetical protein